jgi:hypothetical protein
MRNRTAAILTSLVLWTAACKKPSSNTGHRPLNQEYTDFSSQPVLVTVGAPAFELDIDKDGIKDFAFKGQSLKEDQTSYTYFHVDPLTQSARQQAIMLDAYSFPKKHTIGMEPLPGGEHYWSNSRGLLLEIDDFGYKVEKMGWFNQAAPLYLAVKVDRDQKSYLGWVEIAHQQINEKDQMVITRAAINKLPGDSIITGLFDN